MSKMVIHEGVTPSPIEIKKEIKTKEVLHMMVLPMIKRPPTFRPASR